MLSVRRPLPGVKSIRKRPELAFVLARLDVGV